MPGGVLKTERARKRSIEPSTIMVRKSPTRATLATARMTDGSSLESAGGSSASVSAHGARSRNGISSDWMGSRRTAKSTAEAKARREETGRRRGAAGMGSLCGG